MDKWIKIPGSRISILVIKNIMHTFNICLSSLVAARFLSFVVSLPCYLLPYPLAEQLFKNLT